MKKQVLVLLTVTVLVLITFLPSRQTKGQPLEWQSPDLPASQALQCVPNNSELRTELVDIDVGLFGEILKGKFYYPVPINAPVGTYYAERSLRGVYLMHGIGGKVIGSIENCLLLFL